MNFARLKDHTVSPKSILHYVAGAAMVLALDSCIPPNTSGQNSDYGPFDANGNYIEEWADNPKYRNSTSSVPPVSNVDTDIAVSSTTPLPTSTQQATPPSVPVITPSKPRITSSTSSKQLPKEIKSTTSRAKTTAAKTTIKPTVSNSKPKPKPKTVTKPKAIVRRVTVKKGDTLSGIASKYSSSIAAIQKANGMRSTMLQIGRSIVIP